MKLLLAAGGLLLLGVAARAETVAIVNVNVLPMSSEDVLENRTVVVEDGRIAEIGSVDATEIPEEARVVDGTDRWLMPGLAEMHGHLTEGRELERTLDLFVANGVTVVRGMLGRSAHLELREALRAGDVLGPRLVTSGPSFNGRSVDGPDSAIRMARQQHQAGYDFLKIHPGLTRAEFDAMAETANELGIPFAGHVPEEVGVSAALEAGIATIDHLDGYMQLLLPPDVDPSGGLGGFFGLFLASEAREELVEDVAAASARAGVWNVPTEALFEHVTSPAEPDELAEWPEMRYMAADTVERWKQAKAQLLADASYDPDVARRAIALRRQLILALHEAGAGLLLGSDSPQVFNVPGFAVHRELEYLVGAGLTPYEALRTGTVNPAEFLGQAGVFGTVETGAEADLLLLDDNPLVDIRNTRRIHGVMLRGQWLNRRDLDSLLQSWKG